MHVNFFKNFFFKIAAILKNNLGILFVALGVGILYLLQDVILAAFLNTKINLVHYNLEEIFSYGVKIRDVIDGHFFDGDPYLVEYKRMVTTWDYYPLALLLGIIAKIFGFSDPSPFFIWSDLLLPPISFLIFYALFLNITGNKWWSAFASFMLIAFTNLTQYIHNILRPSFYAPFSWDKVNTFVLSGFNEGFSRMFVPSLSMIFFSLFLLLFYKSVTSQTSSNKVAVLAGVSFGLLFYVYFYYWVFATSVVVSGIIISLFLKRENSHILQRLFILCGSGFIVSIPHWLRYLFFYQNPFYHDYLDRIGIEFSHRPRFSLLTIYVLISMLVLARQLRKGKIRPPIFIYFSSLLLSAVAVSNMQVLMGFSPQPDHWGSRVNAYIILFSLMAFLYWAVHLLSKKMQRAIVLMGFLIFGMIALVAEVNYALPLPYEYVVTPDARASFAWIDQNTPKDAVFVTPAYNTRVILPYLTHANVYLPMATMSLAPENEIILRYLTVYRLFNLVPELVNGSTKITYALDGDLSERERTDVRFSEVESNLSIFGGKSTIYPAPPDKFIVKDSINHAGQFSELYNSFKDSQIGFDDLKWQADYVFWGPAEKLISRFDPFNYPMLKLVYSNPSIKIFKINRTF